MIIHIDWTSVVEVASFLVFFWLLNRILYAPLAAIFRERNARMESGLRAAEEAQRRAEETQRAVQAQLDQARVEAQALMAAAAKTAATERQSLMAQAKSEAEALAQQAQADIRRERETAVEQLRREAAPLAILAASRVVGNSLDTPANRELADRIVAEAGSAEAGRVE